MDYPELVLEAALRSGIPEFPARAEHFVRQAERDLEKALRVGQMEATASLTANSDGEAPLPVDYLAAISPCLVISGGNIITAPDQAFDLNYYAKLPSVITNSTNWLLELEPEIYINAVLLQAFAAQADDRTGPIGQILNERLRAFKREDAIARYGARTIDTTRLRR